MAMKYDDDPATACGGGGRWAVHAAGGCWSDVVPVAVHVIDDEEAQSFPPVKASRINLACGDEGSVSCEKGRHGCWIELRVVVRAVVRRIVPCSLA